MSNFDMLVKLYNIEEDWGFVQEQAKKGIIIRKPIGPEKNVVLKWIGKNFDEFWGSEAGVAFNNSPRTIYVAIMDEKMIGFACYDGTVLGFFGPTGVSEKYRGLGTGKALLMACLLDMKHKGYGYAVIGSVGPAEFYKKAVGAVPIPDSWPGVYSNLIGSSD